MPNKPPALYTTFYSSENYVLNLRQTKNKAKLIMSLKTGLLRTSELPETVKILKAVIPTIFKSTCYNDYEYTFAKEVINTEIGHLFEHILIEYFCLLKISDGFDEAICSGVTEWNWKKYPRGSFQITVTSDSSDQLYLSKALNKSIYLTNLILETEAKLTEDLLINNNFNYSSGYCSPNN